MNTVAPARISLRVEDFLDEDKRQLAAFCTVLSKAAFILTALETLVVLDNHLFISVMMWLIAFAVGVAAAIGRELVLHDQARLTIAIVSTTLFIGAIGCVLFDPKLAPLSLIAALLAVGLAMPFVNSKELRKVCWASGLTLVAVGFLTTFIHLFPHPHTVYSDISMFLALCMSGWVCLSWLLGFHTRFFSLIAELKRAQTDLEDQVSTRTHQLQGELRRARALELELRGAREKTILAREEERRKLRRELHDEFAPNISGCVLTLDGLTDVIADRPQTAPAVLERVCGNLRAIVSDMRQLAYTLFLPSEFDLGLRVAITQLVARVQAQSHEFAVSLHLPDLLPDLPAAVDIAALRIIQEGLINVQRHAQATRCTITLRVIPDAPQLDKDSVLVIDVADNGVGMWPGAPPGVGISEMRERTSELGGEFSITSAPYTGTSVMARIPVAIGVKPEALSTNLEALHG